MFEKTENITQDKLKIVSQNSAWEKEKIASLENYNFHKQNWNKVSAAIWREVLSENDSQLIDIIKNALAEPPGPALALKVLHQIADLSLEHRINKLLQVIIPEWRIWLTTLIQLKQKMSIPDSGVLENTLYDQRDITYLLNNMAKDLIYFSFAYNLKHSHELDKKDGQLTFPNANAQVKIFSVLPEELRNPKKWKFRWNLKDRVWILYSKLGKKYILRERKAPHHMDHLDGEPVNTYSQPSIDEAEKADSFPTIQTDDYLIDREQPIVAVDIQSKEGDSILQFAVYDYLEGVKENLTLEEYARVAQNKEALKSSEQEYFSYQEDCKVLEVEPVSHAEYVQLKAYYGSILLPKYLYKHAFADSNYFNTDSDGFAISINGQGQLVLTAFDFERVKSGRQGGLELDRKNDIHFLMTLKDNLRQLRVNPAQAFKDIQVDLSTVSRQDSNEVYSQMKREQEETESLVAKLEQIHPMVFKRLVELIGENSDNDKISEAFAVLLHDEQAKEAHGLLLKLQELLVKKDEAVNVNAEVNSKDLVRDRVALAMRSFIKSSYKGSAYPQLAVSLSSAITPFYNQYIDRFHKQKQEGITGSLLQKEQPLAVMMALATICANYDYHLTELRN